MTTRLEDLALIGDGETVALVSRFGAIEWLCLPRFDSPASCAALLGDRGNGHWTIAPDREVRKAEQRYQDDTLIVETDLTTGGGTIRITDFMPIRDGIPNVVRIVEGISGRVAVSSVAAFRFDYGNMAPWITKDDGIITMHVGPDRIVMTGCADPEIADQTIIERFTARKGSRHVFVATYGAAHEDVRADCDADDALEETQRYWRDWTSRFEETVSYERQVRRSLLTLKALIHRPSGGVVAAPTTSLPEQAGGGANWDYRYCWLRDAAFTIRSLVDSGYMDEAVAWRDWLLRAVAMAEDKMQIMYRVDGSRRLDEAELPWLSGYRFARPVRIGNAAAGQFQLDVYGEVMNMLYTCEAAGMEPTEQEQALKRSIIARLEKVWRAPDHGLWEDRGQPRHYVSSKVMVWVAFDRFLSGSARDSISSDERDRLSALRDHIHEVICEEGFSHGLNSFTSYFGARRFDASLLLLPKVGFLPASDPRIVGTLAAIERDLVEDGLVRRHLTSAIVPEGAFIACSFWLAECQLLAGRRADAVRTIERAMSVSSGLGLLSEEYDPALKRLNGNYPQALSHLTLISAVLALDRYDEQS